MPGQIDAVSEDAAAGSEGNAPFDAPPMDEPAAQTPQPALQPVSAPATIINGNAAPEVVVASPVTPVAIIEASVGK